MGEPVPVEPLTLEYSGPGAALGPPIEHPGMHLRAPQPVNWRPFADAMLGFFYSASFIFILGYASDILFPSSSQLRLAKPAPPVAGMLLIHLLAMRISRREKRRGLCAGLWIGGLIVLGFFEVYLIAIGYLDWLLVT